MEAVMSGKVSSIAEFDKFMLESRMEDTTEYFYCPLVANVYCRDEYGNKWCAWNLYLSNTAQLY